MATRKANDVAANARREVSAIEFRHKLKRWHNEKSSPEYFAFRMNLIRQTLDDHLRPFEIAAALELAQNRFCEITNEEVQSYRNMNTEWRV